MKPKILIAKNRVKVLSNSLSFQSNYKFIIEEYKDIREN